MQLGFVVNIKLLKPQSNHKTFGIQHKPSCNSNTIIHNNKLRHAVVHQCTSPSLQGLNFYIIITTRVHKCQSTGIPLCLYYVCIVQDDLDVHQQITCPTRGSDKYLWLHNIMQVQNNTLYNIMHWCVPFVLVPVFPESTTLSKDLVQSDQNPKSISNVLEHRLCHRKHNYNNNIIITTNLGSKYTCVLSQIRKFNCWCEPQIRKFNMNYSFDCIHKP